MDVKSVFLNGTIKEQVHVEQPLGFENHQFSNHAYKLNKTLYGLKQAPRAWYERLSKFLIENDFKRENVDTTLFLKKENESLLAVQVYVDDIIFGSIRQSLCKKFTNLMQEKFVMSMMEKLTYFLGLGIKQEEDRFINQVIQIKDQKIYILRALELTQEES